MLNKWWLIQHQHLQRTFKTHSSKIWKDVLFGKIFWDGWIPTNILKSVLSYKPFIAHGQQIDTTTFILYTPMKSDENLDIDWTWIAWTWTILNDQHNKEWWKYIDKWVIIKVKCCLFVQGRHGIEIFSRVHQTSVKTHSQEKVNENYK